MKKKTKKRRRRKQRTTPILMIAMGTFFVVVLSGLILVAFLSVNMDGQTQQVAYIEKLIELEQYYKAEFEKELGLKSEEVVETVVSTEVVGKYDDILSDEDLMKEERIYSKEATREDEIVLLFGGDVLFDESYAVMNVLLNKSALIEDAFGDTILEEMKNADIFMINNEFTYTNRGEATEDKTFTFRAEPDKVTYLDQMGVDIVSIANNHTYDYGEVSIIDTIDTLENANMPYVGAGMNEEEAMKPVYFIINDTKIAFIAATQIERYENPDTKAATATSPGVFRCLYIDPLLEVIGEAKENSDFVVVFPHWGTENEEYPDWAQLEQAPQMVEAGADLIVGAHPHVLQGITYIGDVPVAYSMGNFWFNSSTMDNGLLKVTIKDNGIDSLQFLPGLQSGCVTTLQEGSEKTRVLTYMQGISTGVTFDAEGYITKN
ncbi:MAG: CapA family protein [Eubacteriales bacterium]